MSTPSIKVGQGNWGIKAGNLLGYANTEKKFTPVEFTSSRASNTATRVNASGNIEIVNANIPRIDYFGGQASLLVEPSAQNLALQSAGFQVSGTWAPDNVTITTGTTSAFTAPDGSTDADLLTDNATLGRHRVSQGSLSFTSGTTYAFSVFVKKNSSSRFLLINANTAIGARAALSLDTLAITNINGSGASVENYGNGWYRFSIRGTATSTQATSVFIQMQDADTDVTYIGDGSSFYIWGAQLETGSVATSYIPTTTAAVTRSADVITRTSASALIGQTEGTIYAEVDMRNAISRVGSILQLRQDGSNQLTLGITTAFGGTNTIAVRAQQAGSFVIGFHQQNNAAGIYKIAFAYKSTDCKLYINGTDTGVTIATNNAFTAFSFNEVQLGMSNSVNQFNDRILAVELYPTRIPNVAQPGVLSLQSLTTI